MDVDSQGFLVVSVLARFFGSAILVSRVRGMPFLPDVGLRSELSR